MDKMREVFYFLIHLPLLLIKKTSEFDHQRTVQIVYRKKSQGVWKLKSLKIDPELRLRYGKKPFSQDLKSTPWSHKSKILKFLSRNGLGGGANYETDSGNEIRFIIDVRKTKNKLVDNYTVLKQV